MKHQLFFFYLSILLFSACQTAPEEPSLKGVFLSTNTFQSALNPNKRIVYSILMKSEKGAGIQYAKYFQNCEISINGKKYKFYIKTPKPGYENDVYVDFWVRQHDGVYWNWYIDSAYVFERENHYLKFNQYGLDDESMIDTIPLGISGYSDGIDARMFLSIILEPEMNTRACYFPFMIKYLKEDTLRLNENGVAKYNTWFMIEFARANDSISMLLGKGLLKIFLDAGYDPRTEKIIDKDSTLTGKAREEKIKKVGKSIAKIYYKKAYTYVELHYYNRSQHAINDRYVSEFTIEPGDSVWFTGRISGDSVIAFLK